GAQPRRSPNRRGRAHGRALHRARGGAHPRPGDSARAAARTARPAAGTLPAGRIEAGPGHRNRLGRPGSGAGRHPAAERAAEESSEVAWSVPEVAPTAEPEVEIEAAAEPQPEIQEEPQAVIDEASEFDDTIEVAESSEPDEEADDELLPILDLPRASDDPLELLDAGSEPAASTGKAPKTELDDAEARLPSMKNPGVSAEDLHAEAGRKVLRFHLARMLAREPGTRDGQDPEELHGMRVATRRMRAAWRVFGDAYRPEKTKAYRRRLRELAGLLGAVRDLDVLIEATEAYGEAIGSPRRGRVGAPVVCRRGETGRGPR